LRYAGMEPVTISGGGAVVVDATSASEDITVEPLGSDVKISGVDIFTSSASFESVTVTVAGLTSLTVNGDDGRDKITLTGTIALNAANLTVTAEEIVVTGIVTTTGNVTLTAIDSVS